MALDPRYVIAPSLEMYFVNKDSGLPLENGTVAFFEDNARTIPKDVFQISGTPPNYIYNVLPNPSTLSAVGTFVDGSGNDIIPYYFPLDAQGNADLYYIEVRDSGGVLQFTREGWPNFTTTDVVSDLDITNFVPNGQFLLHDNIPASTANSFVANQVSQDVTVIAPGGWSFERGPTSTATDLITFPPYSSAVQNPTGNPRFAVQIQTTIAGSDTRKDLCLKFPNVNTFASGTQSYNFYFEAQSNTGGDITNVQIILRKFFGTGGSPSATTETVINTITLHASSIQKYNTSILFGTNVGKTLGTNNDDYVQICVRVPPTGVQTALLTDFALIINDVALIGFPQQTEAQQIDPSTAGWLPIPDPNGNDLYCPTVMGPSGLLFSHSEIGRVEGLMIPTSAVTGNLLYCDGTAYLTNDYSSLGIPYSRLQKLLFNTSVNGPLFGTGVNFVNNYVSTGLTTQLMLITNKAGLQSNPVDSGTGFSFNPVTNAGVATINYKSFSNSLGNVTALLPIVTTVANDVSAGTSGMTIFSWKQINVGSVYYSFVVEALAAATLSAGGGNPGKYFDFSGSGGANFRMWFHVAGEIAPAAGGRTLIQVNLASTMSIVDVGYVIASAISSQQMNTITVTGLPTAGSFFTFNANSTTYYVWYQVGGLGTAPSHPFSQLIKVILTGAETNAQIATKTQTAINSQFFAVPDLRGQFLRGSDATGTVDVDSIYRYGYFGNTLTDLGTFQIDQLINHDHAIGNEATGGGATPGSTGGAGLTATFGGFESRPYNAAINWYIRY